MKFTLLRITIVTASHLPFSWPPISRSSRAACSGHASAVRVPIAGARGGIHVRGEVVVQDLEDDPLQEVSDGCAAAWRNRVPRSRFEVLQPSRPSHDIASATYRTDGPRPRTSDTSCYIMRDLLVVLDPAAAEPSLDWCSAAGRDRSVPRCPVVSTLQTGHYVPILRPGRNVWRATEAQASGVIVDAADYYHAFYWAARGARRSILISGWEFDRAVPLLRGADVPPGAEVRFLKFLNGLCQSNPRLHVCLLAWDFHIVLAGEREWLQRVFFHWMTNERLHFRVDDSPVAGGSHHQKFVVIDGCLAFLGGIDLRDACWDDRRHLAVNPDRHSRGQPHKPYHDVQVYLAGGSAPLALEQYFFQRWQRAGGTLPPLPPPARAGIDSPPRGALVLGPTKLGLSRTQPSTRGPMICEIEHLMDDAIADARQLIYIETQYFSSQRICDALLRRMRHASRRLQIVVVVNERAEALKEEVAVGFRQLENIETLRRVAAETGQTLGCYFPLAAGSAERGPEPTYIHSKLMIVDDRFLTIGSANFTNRSMGIDSELHASWEASDSDATLQRRIRRIRVSLLAEHCGVSARSDVRRLVSMDGLVGRLDAIAGRSDLRLRSHSWPSAIQRRILGTIDPQSLPFDPPSSP
jgi:phospholipase D1/2